MNPHEWKILKSKSTFTCPECGYADRTFPAVCPECGRPFARDFVDTQMQPRDPDTTGIFSGRLWARVFPACTLAGLNLSLPGTVDFLEHFADIGTGV